MGDRLRCHYCRNVIGIYEPMITFIDGLALETSRTAEPDAGNRDTECYHKACYLHEHGDDPDREYRQVPP
jgi:hypothetical protein